MDYARQRRLKLLVRVEVKDAYDEPKLIEQLRMSSYLANIEPRWSCMRFRLQNFQMLSDPII